MSAKKTLEDLEAEDLEFEEIEAELEDHRGLIADLAIMERERGELLRARADELSKELGEVMADIDPRTGRYPWKPASEPPEPPPTETP